MNVWFGGGEVATHRSLLAREGVEHIAVNLSAYFKQRQAMRMSDAYDGFKVALYSSEGGLDPRKVESFIDNNIDKFDMVYGLTTTAPQFVPEWAGGDLASFYALASQHRSVGLTESVALDPTLMTPIVAFARREGVELVTASGKHDALSATRWSHVIMSAWLSASKHFELQVWDGRIVKRYARLRRPAAIERHASQIARIGVDLDDLRNNENDAGLTLAVRSWRMWSEGDGATFPLIAGDVAAEVGGTGSHGEIAIANRAVALRTPPTPRERVTLPILGFRDMGGDVRSEVVHLRAKQLRTCNSCFLAQHCPEMQPDSECAFEIPVAITNKAELQGAKNSLLEMQFQRIGLARMAEDLLSQGLDPVVSAEIERFFRMLKILKDLESNTESIVITAKADSGRLSALFGERVGEVNRQLDAPVSSGALMQTVFDADVIDGDEVANSDESR